MAENYAGTFSCPKEIWTRLRSLLDSGHIQVCAWSLRCLKSLITSTPAAALKILTEDFWVCMGGGDCQALRGRFINNYFLRNYSARCL